MKNFYSAERNVQMVLYLLKTYNIKKVIASPGATNVTLVASMQQDPYFEMYSCVDERSAAYMAVGMADESGEPVVLSCTGATSARNYMPALTEAFYRKLPIIAITSTQEESRIGHLVAQVTDRSQKPKDLVVDSVHIQNIKTKQDEWDCNIKLNKVLQTFRSVPGPVHINLTTSYSRDYSIENLPPTKVIRKYLMGDVLPEMNAQGNIAIFVGSHLKFTENETKVIDKFCSVYNAIVLCDHTSSYKGEYRIMHALIGAQDHCKYDLSKIDILIHIGEISGDYDTLRYLNINRVWRVNPDGAFRDTFYGCLEKVFEMNEKFFFEFYTQDKLAQEPTYYATCRAVYESLVGKLSNVPLSNIYVASKLSKIIPPNSVLYLGILNTLRSWNYFEVDKSVRTISNVGGFGIDGIISSLVGASQCNSEKLYFGIVGDLSFFYDMNILGNRHIGSNLRLIVINNGHGQEFEMYNHAAAVLGEDVNRYVAAAGHFGKKSKDLVKHYAQDLGFKYMSAETIEEFDSQYQYFASTDNVDLPIIFEIFTTNPDENKALQLSRTIEISVDFDLDLQVKKIVRKMLGETGIKILKSILK